MSRNGSGTYDLPEAPFVPGTTIASGPMNSNLSDIGAALTQSISKDGQTVYTSDQSMGGNQINDLADGQLAGDAVNLSQVASGALNYGTATGTDTIAVTLNSAFAAYSPGQAFSFIVAATNTGPVTVNVNTIGAGALTWPDGTALAAGDLVTGALIYVEVKAATPVFHLETVVKPPLARAGGTMTGTLTMSGAAINEAVRANLASAATTDIGAASANYVRISGTTTITSLGTATSGVRRQVLFSGTLTLTHNASSLILPTGANITTVAGDCALFECEGGSDWRCVNYQRASGAPLLATTTMSDSLAANVNMTVTGNYYNGPVIAQGASGTWFVSGSVTVANPAGGDIVDVKLWDGTTIIDSCRMHLVSVVGTFYGVATLSGSIASPAGSLRISVSPSTRTDGFIAFNASGNSKDSTLTAIRLV